MKVAIIGSNGFLSSVMGKYCNRNSIGMTSYGLSRPLAYDTDEHTRIDLMNEEIQIENLAKVDVIVYTSGAGIQSNLKESTDSIYRLNTLCPIKINYELSKISFKGIFVTFGSYFEIGNNREERRFDETQLCNSLLKVPNHYCLSKRLLSRYIDSLMENTNHIHIVLPTIYGRGEAAHRIIPYTIRAIKQDEPMRFTDGYQIRQYLYADDIPSVLIELCRMRKTGVINFPGIETYSVRQLVKTICDHYDKKISENVFGKAIREDVGMQNLQIDGTKINKILPNINYTLLKDAINHYDE